MNPTVACSGVCYNGYKLPDSMSRLVAGFPGLFLFRQKWMQQERQHTVMNTQTKKRMRKK